MKAFYFFLGQILFFTFNMINGDGIQPSSNYNYKIDPCVNLTLRNTKHGWKHFTKLYEYLYETINNNTSRNKVTVEDAKLNFASEAFWKKGDLDCAIDTLHYLTVTDKNLRLPLWDIYQTITPREIATKKPKKQKMSTTRKN
jgi:hypothetical protein